jgi:glycine betaine/proline transport system substrate-binding protein
MPSFTSMNEKGEPDILPEFWANAALDPLNKAVAEGRIHSVNIAPILGLGEGWWIPPSTLKKHPELTTAAAVLARPDLFPHPEDPSKGGFHICPPGWACELINKQMFKGWGMEAKGWKIVDTGSAAGLDGSMSKAVERGENWFGYYWSPTSMIGKYKMVGLDMGEWGGDDNWHKCLVKPEQDCGTPKASSWIKSEVYTVTTDNYKKTAGKDGMKYLENRVYPGEVMNGMLVYMADNQAAPADAAIEFLKKHENVWTKWVSSSAAKKIKGSL